jgi:hypothetical protein
LEGVTQNDEANSAKDTGDKPTQAAADRRPHPTETSVGSAQPPAELRSKQQSAKRKQHDHQFIERAPGAPVRYEE